MNKGDDDESDIVLGDREIPQASMESESVLDARLAQIEIQKVSQNYSRSHAHRKFNEECKREEAREQGKEMPGQAQREKLIEYERDDG
jgi:hypothetical protein